MASSFNKAAYLSSVQQSTKRSKCCCPRKQVTSKEVPAAAKLDTLLFKGAADNTTTKNAWKFWRTKGGENGKQSAYDNTLISMLQICDSEGTCVTYCLLPWYQGKTMLEIAQSVTRLKDPQNPQEEWNAGTEIGTLVEYSKAPGVDLGNGRVSFSESLRIGVGDLGRGADTVVDWAFLFPLDGNCGQDFGGQGCFSIGGEFSLSDHQLNENDYTGFMELRGREAPAAPKPK